MLKAIGIVLAIVVAVLALLLTWGVAIEPRLILDQGEEAGVIPNLPPDWEGAEVAVLGDFQIGMWLDNVGMVERAVRAIIERRPALVLLTGDVVYGPGDQGEDAREPTGPPVPMLLARDEQAEAEGGGEAAQVPTAAIVRAWRKRIDTAVAAVRPLTDAGIPTYAVLGNHDYGMSAKTEAPVDGVAGALTAALEQAGITVLENAAVPLASPGAADLGASGATLWLGAVGPVYPNLAEPLATLDGMPGAAPRIVLMHNPESFAELPADSAPVALAGHTHGGQIRLPLLPFWSWLEIVRPGEVHSDGWITSDYGAPGNRLYVNRGIGFSLVPIRIYCAPELTWLRLTRAGPET